MFAMLLGGCALLMGPESDTLSKADQTVIAAVMDNNCRVPEDCTFGVELDGRVFMSPPAAHVGTNGNGTVLTLPKSSPIMQSASGFGCIAFKGGGPKLTANDDCSLTGIPEQKPLIRLTLTRRYSEGRSKTMTWRVDAVNNTITPIVDEDDA